MNGLHRFQYPIAYAFIIAALGLCCFGSFKLGESYASTGIKARIANTLENAAERYANHETAKHHFTDSECAHIPIAAGIRDAEKYRWLAQGDHCELTKVKE